MTLQERHIEHIKAWQASGLTQGVYCQQHGLNAKSFSRWLKTYQLSNQSAKPVQSLSKGRLRSFLIFHTPSIRTPVVS